MNFQSKYRVLALVLGDLCLFAISLWAALTVRNWSIPNFETLFGHLTPFSVIFIIWLIVFYIAGLYDKQTVIFRKKLPRVIFNTLVVNSLLVIVFFYFVPYFGITPKTILFLDVFFSFIFVFVWRNYFVTRIRLGKKEKIFFACKGEEVDQIIEEIKNNPIYDISISTSIESLAKEKKGMASVVVDLYDKENSASIKNFYPFIFSGIRFVPIHNLYEEIFDREPISLLDEIWFLENVSSRSKLVYDISKRLIDFFIAVFLGLISLAAYPFVWLAIKIEDGGDIFISQKRVGRNMKIINLYKFRTMTGNETGKWLNEGSLKVTKVGKFLRKTRIDELPQLWNVIRGDISLVGPRPDIIGLDKRLSEQISYYSSRTLVLPGLSGWAQINQEKPPQSVEETKQRLSYDLYYIKNRSFFLDFKIVLRTIKTLLSRSGA